MSRGSFEYFEKTLVLNYIETVTITKITCVVVSLSFLLVTESALGEK